MQKILSIQYDYDIKLFIDKNSRRDQLFKKIYMVAELLSKTKPPPSKLYKKIENDIWEIRYHDIRIFCYRYYDQLFLINAIIKKRDKIGKIETDINRKKLLELKNKLRIN